MFFLLAYLPQLTHAQTGGQITLKRILDGAKGQLAPDSATTVSDTAYFNSGPAGRLDTPYQVKNIITFSINEYAKVVLPDSFRVTANLRIYYTLPDLSVDSADQSFLINYGTAGTYTMRSSFVFKGAHRVNVKVLGVTIIEGNTNTAASRTTNTVSTDILSALLVTNEMEVHPVYKLSCMADAVKSVSQNIDSVIKTGELEVNWPVMTGADVYDLEWAYIDQSALSDGRYGDPSNPSATLIFENNTTRVTISANSYSIPLLYDAPGTLYYRVRGVQEKAGYRRIETDWSSNTSNGLGVYQYGGHEPNLNWQSSISFSEDGKRKVTVSYYDGSLKNRQIVTKDNTTNTIIAAETLYDYQGRPTIQVMPAPTLNKILSYAHNLNAALNGAEYDKDQYDVLASPESYLNASAAQMSSQSGANQYYSPNNPEKSIGYNQYIPDADGYAFSEIEYTADNTGRISRQGEIGRTFKLGSGHETKYSYNTPTKNELYALFGTEVGDVTHYFKNTVTDGNGQTTVTYLDMHNRTIATALAGVPENGGLENLSSLNSIVVTDTVSGAENAIIEGNRITSRKEHFATQGDSVRFVYELTPPVLQKQNCKDTAICYTGMYDLEIRITDDVFSQHLPGGKPVDTVLRAKLDTISVDCDQPVKPIRLAFSLWLDKGSYTFTKTLTISQAAMDYYRDSVFLKSNVCKSYEQILEEQKAIQRTIPCEPDCASCLAGIGLWEEYRIRYMTDNGYVGDSVNYRAEAWASYNEALATCNELCGKGTETDAMRQAMLLDMSAPGGQYALPRDTANRYSIFYLDMKDTTYNYADTSIHYLNEIGERDMVYDIAGGQYVLPQKLGPAEFAAAFKSSWAEALLPLHPEYCKLLTKNGYRLSEEWDMAFEKVETYQEARDAGYLNPQGMSNRNFPINKKDPLDNTTLTGKLISQLEHFNGGSYDMWRVAVASVKCDESGAGCINSYSSPEDAFNSAKLCEGDLNMAWRSFRSMYLGAKRTVIDDYLKSLNCGASAKELLDSGKVLRFTSSTDQLANAGLGASSAYLKDKNAAETASRTLSDSAYTANCTAYVSYWVQQLSGCYDTTAIKTDIIPKLLAVCKEGSDVDHPAAPVL
ncbi:hypothetical protein [Chitinophaga agri]|uniref:RHS repeat protein n=1 Tax=Chitinophaga agri TaxID=2703787 RepID=A0A6B9ZBW3_9BACT|nr:hypothetical protein [Chitinophaga agri]QHS58605.1 hypothetical protein GWR21_03030 [Chitinophaga agri]